MPKKTCAQEACAHAQRVACKTTKRKPKELHAYIDNGSKACACSKDAWHHQGCVLIKLSSKCSLDACVATASLEAEEQDDAAMDKTRIKRLARDQVSLSKGNRRSKNMEIEENAMKINEEILRRLLKNFLEILEKSYIF